MKKVLTYLLCFIYLTGVGQTYSTVVPDKVYSDFIAQFKIDKKIKKITPRIWTWELIELFDPMDNKYPLLENSAWGNDSVRKLFPKDDSLFIRKQFDGLLNTDWKSSDWPAVELLDSTQMKKVYANGLHGRMKKLIVYGFSAPIFSSDYKYAVIQEYYTCGFMCSTLCYYLYRKTAHNTWVKVTRWNCIAT